MIKSVFDVAHDDAIDSFVLGISGHGAFIQLAATRFVHSQIGLARAAPD
ncbi:MAG: hypothetical protein KDN22_18990 [Verrucomicrobiae bacterium]|nr:hypothetical protein [Verrucomicrobiae bacterium]